MNFTKTFSIAGAAAFIILTGCSKRVDEPVQTDPSPVIGKLAKLEYNDGTYDSLFYNSDLTLRKVKVHTIVPGPYDEIFLFTYDADKKLTSITDNNGELYEYKYVDAEITAVTHYVNGVKKGFKFYDYENGKLAVIEEYQRFTPGDPGFEFVHQQNLSYYPDGNLKQEVGYIFSPNTRIPVKDVTIDYADYDDKINTLEQLGRFLYPTQLPMAKNNIRKRLTKDEISGVTTEFNFEYAYNDLSFPVTHEMSYVQNGAVHKEKVKYHYY